MSFWSPLAWQFLSFLVFFMSLPLWKRTRQSYCRMSLRLWLRFSHQTGVMGIALLITFYHGGCDMNMTVIGDVKLDHLVKVVVPSRFLLHCKVISPCLCFLKTGHPVQLIFQGDGTLNFTSWKRNIYTFLEFFYKEDLAWKDGFSVNRENPVLSGLLLCGQSHFYPILNP